MTDTMNPKDKLGKSKLPYHLAPESAIAYMSMGLYEGMVKYGRTNWRASKVLASVYYAALLRHALDWFEGQNQSDDSQNMHLGNCLACLAILVDAKVHGTLVDDRNYITEESDAGLRKMKEQLLGIMRNIESLYGDKNPKQYDHRDAMKESGNEPDKDPTGEVVYMSEFAQFDGMPAFVGGIHPAMKADMEKKLREAYEMKDGSKDRMPMVVLDGPLAGRTDLFVDSKVFGFGDIFHYSVTKSPEFPDVSQMQSVPIPEAKAQEVDMMDGWKPARNIDTDTDPYNFPTMGDQK